MECFNTEKNPCSNSNLRYETLVSIYCKYSLQDFLKHASGKRMEKDPKISRVAKSAIKLSNRSNHHHGPKHLWFQATGRGSSNVFFSFSQTDGLQAKHVWATQADGDFWLRHPTKVISFHWENHGCEGYQPFFFSDHGRLFSQRLRSWPRPQPPAMLKWRRSF